MAPRPAPTEGQPRSWSKQYSRSVSAYVTARHLLDHPKVTMAKDDKRQGACHNRCGIRQSSRGEERWETHPSCRRITLQRWSLWIGGRIRRCLLEQAPVSVAQVDGDTGQAVWERRATHRLPGTGLLPLQRRQLRCLVLLGHRIPEGEATATAGERRVSGSLRAGWGWGALLSAARRRRPILCCVRLCLRCHLQHKQALVRNQIRRRKVARRGGGAYPGAVLRLLIVIVDQKHRHHQVEHDELRQDQVAATTTAVETEPRGTIQAESRTMRSKETQTCAPAPSTRA